MLSCSCAWTVLRIAACRRCRAWGFCSVASVQTFVVLQVCTPCTCTGCTIMTPCCTAVQYSGASHPWSQLYMTHTCLHTHIPYTYTHKHVVPNTAVQAAPHVSPPSPFAHALCCYNINAQVKVPCSTAHSLRVATGCVTHHPKATRRPSWALMTRHSLGATRRACQPRAARPAMTVAAADGAGAEAGSGGHRGVAGGEEARVAVITDAVASNDISAKT